MESSSSQPRRSSRPKKPVNFDDYDDIIFEDDLMLSDEIDEEEGTFEK